MTAYLEAKFGWRAWLHAASLHPYAYPPAPDDLLGSQKLQNTDQKHG